MKIPAIILATFYGSTAALLVLAGSTGLAFVGGAPAATLSLSGYKWTPSPASDSPPMDIPRSMREWNWGGGSCVHASTVMEFRWMGEHDYAAYHRRHYRGGESSYGLRRKLDGNKVEYCCTENGDPAFLEWASRSRRGAVIFYYPNHSICFCGYGKSDQGDVAWLLDNNRINAFIAVPKAAFIRNWRGYGGFALTPIAIDGKPLWPAPNKPFPAFYEAPKGIGDLQAFHPRRIIGALGK